MASNYTVELENIITSDEFTNNQIILTIVLGFICITTIASNLLVLYIFLKSKQALRYPSHLLLANLAVADLMVGVAVMPLLLTATVANDFKWYFGEFICRVFEYLHFLLCATSMLSIVGVTIERYIGVTYPLQHRRMMSKKRVIYMMVLIWILAFSLTAIPLTIWPVLEMPSDYVCYSNLRRVFVVYLSLVLYFTPVVITFVLYIFIYRSAVRPFSVKLHNTNDNSTESEEKFLKWREKQKVLTKKMIILNGTMILMFGPLFIMFFLRGINSPLFSLSWFLLLGWVRYTNSCVNPFVLALAVPGYKKEFYRLFFNERQRESTNEAIHSSSTSLPDNKGSLADNTFHSTVIQDKQLEFKRASEEDSSVGIPEVVIVETENFLKLLTDTSESETSKEKLIRDRGSKLLSVLALPLDHSGQNRNRTEDDRKYFRKSVLIPILQRRSEIVRIDANTGIINELDEIIEKLEQTMLNM